MNYDSDGGMDSDDESAPKKVRRPGGGGAEAGSDDEDGKGSGKKLSKKAMQVKEKNKLNKELMQIDNVRGCICFGAVRGHLFFSRCAHTCVLRIFHSSNRF